MGQKFKSYTDIEQSWRLDELGVPESTADLWWRKCPIVGVWPGDVPTFDKDEGDACVKPEYYPCWSLAALQRLLPQTILYRNLEYDLNFDRDWIDYTYDDGEYTDQVWIKNDGDPVDMVYETLVWLLENNLMPTRMEITTNKKKINNYG